MILTSFFFVLACAEDPLCGQLHRINSLVAIHWISAPSSYLIEFDDAFVQYEAPDRSQVYKKNQSRVELCGTYAVACTLTNALSACQQQVLVLFDSVSQKFHCTLGTQWKQVIQVLANGVYDQAQGNQLATRVTERLNQFGFGEKILLTFNPDTSEFYIAHNREHVIYRWNTNSNEFLKLSCPTNQISALFYVASKKQVSALLWRMDTLFELQAGQFIPTRHSTRDLLHCSGAFVKPREVPFYLCLLCIALVIALLYLLVVIFWNIQKMYAYNFFQVRKR